MMGAKTCYLDTTKTLGFMTELITANPVAAAVFAQFKAAAEGWNGKDPIRSEEHTSELQSLMRISYAVFCLKKKKTTKNNNAESKTKNDNKGDNIKHRDASKQ